MKYKKEYLESGGVFCPFCKGQDITGESVEIEQGYAYQEMSCVNCGASWQDRYDLADAVIIEEPADKS